MLNHIHLVVSANNVAGFVRDYKSYTSKLLKENMKLTEPNVLKLFYEDGVYRFWGRTNIPRLLESEGFYEQKVEYISNNPVKKNYVMLSEHWYWSSANEICELKVNGFI
jgi:putative transposase